MDSGIATALIGAVGVVLGAGLAAVGSAYAASRKVREIELNYAHKIRDNYLENARRFAGEVYLPINILITNLNNAYYDFQSYVDFETAAAPDSALAKFRDASETFVKEIDMLFARGADAYLTNEFDEALMQFLNFLRNSIDETEVKRKRVLRVMLNGPIFEVLSHESQEASARLSHQNTVEIEGATSESEGTENAKDLAHAVQNGIDKAKRKLNSTLLNVAKNSPISIRLGPIDFYYSETEILSAPITSRDFETKFLTMIPMLKYSIKEVTLGTHTHG